MRIEYEEFAKEIKNYKNDFITRFQGVYMTDDHGITVDYGSPNARRNVTRAEAREMAYEIEELLSNHGAVDKVHAVLGDRQNPHVIEVTISFQMSEVDDEGYSIPEKPYSIPWTKKEYDILAKLL